MGQILKHNFKSILIVTLLISSLLIESCGKKEQDQNQENKISYTDTIAVETQKIGMKKLNLVKTFSSSLEGEEQANIIAKIPERIMKINVKVGDYVKAGSELIELDKGGASSQFYQAQAAFLNAQKNYERMQNLLKVGAVSQQSFDAVQTQYEVAKANFDAAKSTVEITSPISGVVTAININPGDLANPQVPLATVANIYNMKAKFNVGENDLTNFYVGQPVKIYSELSPELIQTGKVIQISTSANQQSRTFEIQAKFQNSKDKWFKPGMFCSVNVDLKSKHSDIVIPAAAVIKDANNKDGCYLVKDNKAVFKNVTTGMTDGLNIEILSGLKQDDEIVTLGMNNLKNGTVVIVTNK